MELGSCLWICVISAEGEGTPGLVLPPSSPTHQHTRSALPHFRAVTLLHPTASHLHPRGPEEMGEQSPHSWVSPRRTIDQPRGCCPDPLPSCLCPQCRHRWSIRVARFSPSTSAAISQGVGLGLKPGCCQSRCWGGPGIAAGEQQELSSVGKRRGFSHGMEGMRTLCASTSWRVAGPPAHPSAGLSTPTAGRSSSARSGALTVPGAGSPRPCSPAPQTFVSSCHVPLFDSFHLLPSSPAQ